MYDISDNNPVSYMGLLFVIYLVTVHTISVKVNIQA